jgi:pimeloyl-ACP methyl ester carboxylesterase
LTPLSAANVDSHPYVTAAVGVTAALAGIALVNHYVSKKADRDNPPVGKFIEVDGVRLHYLDQGKGEPLVLLHGNGSMIQDFQSSGLIDTASQKYRVIVFDRPGYGYSQRPRGTIWTPEAQADLIVRALRSIGVSRATILGHSWGASVAVALALKYPEAVRSLILASGYYYPTVRADALLSSVSALPVIGDILSYTIAPILGRMMWPLSVSKMFSPKQVPSKFAGFPKEMALRPSQLRASSEEAALMIPDAFGSCLGYRDLALPVVIIAGEEDKVVDSGQSEQLHRVVPKSTLHRIVGAGHMIQQTDTRRVMSAIDEAIERQKDLAAVMPNAA